MAAYHQTAAILSIGDELTLGQTLDTNSQRLSRRLVDAGVVVHEHATVDDDADRIAIAIHRLASGADLLIVTGGLGPTADDLTRPGLAQAMGEQLTIDADALRDLEAWFARTNRAMPEQNRQQALRPASARCLPNGHGTAPGIAARIGACDVWCFPGPPRELTPMFERELDVSLRTEPGRVVATRTLPTFGLGESDIADRLRDLMERGRLPIVGTTASGGVVTCRLRYDAIGSQTDADRALDASEADIRSRLGPAVLRTGGATESLVEVVTGLLRGQGETVCTVESCTGGLLGAVLTDQPGSSDVFVGGFVTYSDALKTAMVGVEPDLVKTHGAVSGPVARAMAAGGLERTGADHALAITGVAGPDGGSAEKPVGTVWIACASRSGPADIRRFKFPGDREGVRMRSRNVALGMLRLRLIGAAMSFPWECEREA